MSQRRPQPTIDLGYPTQAHGRIPAFASIEDEAAFWDTHDVTDFVDDAQRVDLVVGADLAERLTLRLDKTDRDALVRVAGRMGIAPSALARCWLVERLREEAAADAVG